MKILMKKILPVLLLSLLPSLSFAGGNHGGHDDRKAASVGLPSYSADVSRTIEALMADNLRFSARQIKVNVGETIRFFVENSGKLQHELVIGDTELLQAHAQMMRKMPDLPHKDPIHSALKLGKQVPLYGSLIRQVASNLAV